MDENSQILVNRIITPDGTELISRHRHDYKTYTDANGETYMVDGGSYYLRRNVNKTPAQEASLYTDSPHEEIREAWTWGTYGPKGDQPLKLVKLKDLEPDHIDAIIKNCSVTPHIKQLFNNELEYRKYEKTGRNVNKRV